MYLNEHGSFECKIINENTILTDATGAWNMPLIERYQEKIFELVSKFEGKPWKHIAILRKETLFIPEVEQSLVHHLQWRKKNNLISDTVILSNSDTAAISESQMKNMFESADIELFFAEDIQEALNK